MAVTTQLPDQPQTSGSAVARYLGERFLDAASFAAHCGIELDELERLIATGVAPGASYDVDAAGTMRSLVFGAVDAPGATKGHWFNPDMQAWVMRGRAALAAHGGKVEAAVASLQADFRAGYGDALRAAHAAEGAVPGFTTVDGSFDETAFEAQFAALWQHLLGGTFGLCVAHPVDEAHIVAKEVAQARLTHVTDNGSRRDFDDAEAALVRDLLERYAALSMPFSPAEYARSSRKRLVDDLRDALG